MQRRKGRKKRRRDAEEEDERPSKRGKEEADEDDDMSDELDEYDTEYSSGRPWSEEEDARVRLRFGWPRFGFADSRFARLCGISCMFSFCLCFVSLTLLVIVLL